jgi:hypothetical protein
MSLYNANSVIMAQRVHEHGAISVSPPGAKSGHA